MRANPALRASGPLARWVAPLALFAALALAGSAALPGARVHAAVRPFDDSAGAARPVAPEPGEALPEGRARFAVEVPPNARATWIVASTSPFSTRGWTAVPRADDTFHLADASSGLVPYAALGLAVTAPTEVWWTVASLDRTTGRLSAPAPRSFTVLPSFARPSVASPYLVATQRGTLAPALPAPAAAAPRLRLAAGFDFAPTAPSAVVPAGALPAPAAAGGAALPPDPVPPEGTHAYLVQFAAPPADAERAAIARAGGRVVSYVPDQAYLVRMTPAARQRLADAGVAAWIGDWAPAYKLSPLIAAPAGPTTGEYLALVFYDGDARGVARALGGRGYAVTAVSENAVNKLVRFRAPAGDLSAAAGLSEVAWIEPVSLKTLENVNAQWILQTDSPGNRRVWDQGLRGLGQVVMTSDSGIDVTHYMFADPAVPLPTWGDYPTHRKVIAYQLGSNSPAVQFGDHANGNSYHGSHTACSMVGNDSTSLGGNLNANDGMAKDAKIYFMDIGGPTLANSVAPFDDLNNLFQPPYTGNAGGAARVSSNSWGSNVNGAYDLEAMQVDQFVWAHPDFYVAFSAGNAGGYATVGSPATAKDCASMGGVINGSVANASQIYASTSRGPTADGRIKPTLCAPAQSVYSAQNGPSNYAYLSGTSMASPTGTGAMTLARQYLTDGYYPTGTHVPANGFTPSAALLKALAINSASQAITGYSGGPLMNVGFGRIDLDSVLYFAGDAKKLLLVDETSGLGQGQYIEYQVNVVDSSQPLKVSLCWSDYPGNPAAAVQLVNNLDLYVKNGATTYKGNVFSSNLWSVTGGSADTLNVEEVVNVNAPATGLWTVRVSAPRVPVGPQPFGLAVTGGVGQTAGTLALDRAEYGSTSTVLLRVVDTNAGPSSVNVNVASTTEPGGENVTLTGANGVFNGTLALTPTAPVGGNGVLSVSSGDAITATYLDASPAATLTANASVSFAQPVITYVRATSQGVSGTLVTFNTQISATGRVYYGATPALELGSVPESGARLAHQVLLTGLTPGTSYYYDVEATALNGNAVRDNLGGAHYRFTAKPNGDVLLVVGETGFPRLATWENALKATGYDFDEWIGPLADHPVLGDAGSGLRGYRAVLWQAGIDQYPPFSQEQRGAVTSYLNGGGRLCVIGHDVGWALGDPTSGFSDTSTVNWLANTLHTTFLVDPATISTLTGTAADPISGAYAAAPVAYTPVRAGAAGDEVNFTGPGSASYTWTDNYTPGPCGFRWEDGIADGTPGTAVWAGLPSRLATMYFELTAADNAFTLPSTIRNDIVDKTLTWLFGRPRPAVTVTSPNGGEIVTASPVSIGWTESAGPGRAIAARAIDYSLDGGDSWIPITGSAGPPPYSWNASAVPNTSRCLVRVRLTDDGAPSLSAADQSNATFTLARPGGDTSGPVVVAGSIAISPNPVVRPNPVTLSASATDVGLGASSVTAAEWAFGDYAPLPGEGQPLTVTGSGATVSLSGTLDTTPFLTGARKLWVRAKDAAGNWGPASALAVQVNGPDLVGVGGIPTVAFLAQNAPNPFAATTSLRFGLPRAGRVALAVYTVQGRLVRRLVGAELAAGEHAVTWDRTDDAGRRVAPGVYYAALVTPGGRFEKRMLALP